MAGRSERRMAPRIVVSGHLGARARATLDVDVIDISQTGARIQHAELLRPGATYAFELSPTLGSLVLTARVVHSAVVGTEATPDGERHLRYQTGLTFVRTTAQQQATLVTILERLSPGGDLGEGRLVL